MSALPGSLSPVPDKSAARPLWRQLLAELWNALLFLTWHQFASLVRPPPDHREGTGRPVVLVSGLTGPSTAWTAMRRELIAGGHPVYVADRGTSLASIWRQAAKLRAFIESRGLTDCDLVCHSMGGLATLCALPDIGARVRRVVTLGTPFLGTWLGLFFPSPSAWQVIPGSRFLARVGELLALFGGRFRAGGASHYDEIVIPLRSATPPGCTAVRLPELGHCNSFMAAPSIAAACAQLEGVGEGEQQHPDSPSDGTAAA